MLAAFSFECVPYNLDSNDVMIHQLDVEDNYEVKSILLGALNEPDNIGYNVKQKLTPVLDDNNLRNE